MKLTTKSTMMTMSVALALACGAPGAASAQNLTVNFDDLTHPATGVGPAHPAYTQNGFSLLRINDPSDPSSNGNHFHTTAGNGTAGLPNSTAAIFFSDDGAPFRYFYGGITGTNNNNYGVGTEKAFDLRSLDVLDVQGVFTLTASSGATLTIDHAGTYDASALTGFQDITEFRHDYTGTGDGSMTVDNITFRAAAVPEPGMLPAALVGLTMGALLLRRKRANA